MPALWQPLYLRLWVLVTFIAAFAILIPILEVLLIISNRDKGLSTAQQRFEYAWKYGPTALLTIITLAWDRVTFQIQILAPWHQMAKSATSASNSILLDYLDMFPPAVIARALKRRSWAPAAALSASLVLQVIVTLSTSLIDLHITEMESLVPIELKTCFNDAASSTEQDSRLAYFTMVGMWGLRFPYPEGTTAQYAYQTLADPLLLGTGVRLNVDSLVATWDCDQAGIRLIDVSTEWQGLDFYIWATFEMRSADCLMTSTTNVWTPAPENFTSHNFVRMFTGSCGDTTTSIRNRTSIVVGRLSYTIDYPDLIEESRPLVSDIKLTNSTQAICVPRYDIRKVNFVHDTTSAEKISPVQDLNPRTLNMIDAWDFLIAQLNVMETGLGIQTEGSIEIGNGSVINFDEFTAHARSSELSQVPYSELTDFSMWLKGIPAYFQKFCAQIAERSLLEPCSEMAMGNQSQIENRLIVSGPICHAMAALLVLCILHCVIITLTLPRNSRMAANPTSILGTAWMAMGATSLLFRLQDQGLGELGEIREQLGTTAYRLSQTSPDILKLVPDRRSSRIRPHFYVRPKRLRRGGKYAIILHPMSRALFFLCLAGEISILEALLRLSQRNNDIGPADLRHYIQYSWTVVPSVFFTAMALIASSIDGATRSLQPFLTMKKGGRFPQTFSLDLLDGSLPRMLFSGLRNRSWPSVFTIIASSVSSVFTIFSGSLYINQYLPITLATTLRANTTFNRSLALGVTNNALGFAWGENTVASSLVLGRNGSFPPFLYKDLAFPSLVLNEGPLMVAKEYNVSNSSALNIVAKVPAVRSKLHCNVYSGEKVRTNLTMNYTIARPERPRIPNPLRIDIDGEGCFVKASDELKASPVMIRTLQEGAKEGEITFGSSSGSVDDKFHNWHGWISGCGLVTYAWGHVTVHANGEHTVNAFALSCNETLETVDTAVHFKSSSLIIDSKQPPVPDEASSRPADLEPWPQRDFPYFRLVQPENLDSSQIFDPSFSHLILSRRAVLPSDLADAAAVEKVAAAIRAQHELVRSIAIDEYHRIDIKDLSLDEAPAGTHVSPRNFLYAANATILPGQLRVVQEIWPTRVLQALLAATLASSLIAWWLMPRTDVIVGSPTNIARKLALTAGGNLFDDILACGLTYEEIERALNSQDRIFTIGWRTPTGSQGKERYGIWALSPGEMEGLKQGDVNKASWIPLKRWRRLGTGMGKTRS
ncbi:hypothetical protein GGR51DRAFT_503675 [Nemania sp. FL0031]|nr:hypothetical protein GGR51DRAFT_503675 [Nemania sp. FL0031]